MTPLEAPPRPGADPQWDSAWMELRSLLVGPEQQELGVLKKRLGDRSEQIEAVATVLPPAVESSAQRGPELKRSLEPVVRDVVQLTLKHDPAILIDAVLPVIGTLIRKYISAALQDFVDAINLAQEKSLSMRSVRWRAEAWRTGKPFAEVVLANSVLYRVEQVFLIHRKTGLLLMHRTADGVVAKDADMVSGMLTAIGDFAHDSFQDSAGDGELSTVQVGDLRIWVRHGPHTALAAVVRGVAPPDLVNLLDRNLSEVERKFGSELERYGGDPSLFEGASPHVTACLVGRGGAEPRGNGTVYAAAALVLGAILLAVGLYWRDGKRLRADVERLKAEPGFAITEVKRGWLRHSIEGLRDPLAIPPSQAAAGLDRHDTRFDPFVSLHPKMVALREFEPLKRHIEATMLEFANDSAEVDRVKARSAAEAIGRLAAMAPLTGSRISIAVAGSADPKGLPERNERLARERAAAAIEALVQSGIARELFEAGTAPEGSRTVRFEVRTKGAAN